jgi:competence protein ComEA
MSIKRLIVVAIMTLGMLNAMSLGELNKASKDDLISIKGIGDKKAKSIIKDRPYKSFDDLLKVKGVGPALVENIKKDVKSK